MLKKEFEKKYDTLIRDIANYKKVDMDDAFAIVKDVCDDRYGDGAKDYELLGMTDWELVKKDYQKLIAK